MTLLSRRNKVLESIAYCVSRSTEIDGSERHSGFEERMEVAARIVSGPAVNFLCKSLSRLFLTRAVV